jgi:hypothetical protein
MAEADKPTRPDEGDDCLHSSGSTGVSMPVGFTKFVAGHGAETEPNDPTYFETDSFLCHLYLLNSKWRVRLAEADPQSCSYPQILFSPQSRSL